MNTLIAVTLLVILGLILGWHWLFVGAVAVSATVWAVVVTSIVLFCVGVLSLFILTGLGVLFVTLFGLIWTILAVILLPVLFPILVPLLIILLFISYIRKKQKNNLIK
jgi:hypothetical protein